MEAVISGQAGVALLVDGDSLSSIHVHDPNTPVARRAGEFHYLFGAASDLVFVENISPDEVRQELQAAADGEDVTQLALLLLAPDRSEEVRRTAAEELAELLTANSQAVAFAERLLLATTLPDDADPAGALRLCSDGPAPDFLVRVERLQPFVRLTQEAWQAIPEEFFGDSPEDCRTTADAIFVREGVVRQFVLAAAGELGLPGVVLSALQIPAVQSFPNHRNVVTRWKSNLAVDKSTAKPPDVSDMLAEGAQWEEGPGRHRKAKRRKGMDRTKELRRVERVKAAIEDAMRHRDVPKVREFVNDLVHEQIAKSGPVFACKSLCDLAKRAQDLGLHALQLEFTARAVELKNDDGWSWQQHGKALLDNGRLTDALEAYEQAIFFDKSAASYNGRAETLRSLNRPQEAVEAYEAVIATHPEDIVAKNGRAETLRSLNRPQEALEAYEAVIAAHPEDIVAKNGRACVLIDMSRFDEALQSLPVEDPSRITDWIGFHIRGMCLLKQNRLPEAIKLFEVGVQRCAWPQSRDYFASALAIANLRQGKIETASHVLGEMDKQHATVADRNEIVVAPGPLLVRLHVWGVCGREEEANQTYERLPATLRQVEQETKDELKHRHILHLPPERSEDWLFQRLCDCLLVA